MKLIPLKFLDIDPEYYICIIQNKEQQRSFYVIAALSKCVSDPKDMSHDFSIRIQDKEELKKIISEYDTINHVKRIYSIAYAYLCGREE